MTIHSDIPSLAVACRKYKLLRDWWPLNYQLNNWERRNTLPTLPLLGASFQLYLWSTICFLISLASVSYLARSCAVWPPKRRHMEYESRGILEQESRHASWITGTYRFDIHIRYSNLLLLTGAGWIGDSITAIHVDCRILFSQTRLNRF